MVSTSQSRSYSPAKSGELKRAAADLDACGALSGEGGEQTQPSRCWTASRAMWSETSTGCDGSGVGAGEEESESADMAVETPQYVMVTSNRCD